MNWSRAKTILIVLFVCSNLFLLSIILTSNNTKKTSDSVTDAAIQLMQSNGITVDVNILKGLPTKTHIPELESVTADRESFIKAVLGAEYKADGDTYSSDKGTLYLNENYFELIPSEKHSVSSRNSSTTAQKSLSLVGIKDKNLVSDMKISDTGNYTLHISKRKGNMHIFCSSIDAVISEHRIQKVSGSWFSETGENSSETALTPVLSLLTDYALHNNDGEKSVTAVLCGYFIPDNKSASGKFYPTPSIKVFFLDGSEAYIPSAES